MSALNESDIEPILIFFAIWDENLGPELVSFYPEHQNFELVAARYFDNSQISLHKFLASKAEVVSVNLEIHVHPFAKNVAFLVLCHKP